MKNQSVVSNRTGAAFFSRRSRFAPLAFAGLLLFLASCRKNMDALYSDAPVTESAAAARLGFTGNSFYVATNGNDANAGTEAAPFKTLDKLSNVLKPGDIAYVRGGTYRISKSTSTVNRSYLVNLQGTVTDSIFIVNYPGEQPVFNMDEQLIPGEAGDGPVGLKIENSRYLHVKGLRFTGLKQNPANINTPAGMILYNVDNSLIDQVEVDHIEGYGIYLQGGSDNNRILNTDVHHIGDLYSGWGGANGFNITGGDPSTNNVFEGCRAWWCSDDGFDLFGTNSVATFKNCWAFWNGYQAGNFLTAGDGQGFKLGPTATDLSGSSAIYRTLIGCVAFENRLNGFDQNSQSNTTCKVALYNNTAFGNKSNGYFFGANTNVQQVFKNNINFNNGIWGDEIQSGPNVSNNTWNAISVSNSDFQSLSSVGADGPRQADGSLPDLPFMKLTASSGLINAGVNVGYPFLGSAPDLGAFETGGITTTPANNPPTANAGADKTITLPANSISFAGTGTDPEGYAISYAWTYISGPATPVLAGAASASLTASSLIAGTYTFRLTVTDNMGLKGFDDVSVIVKNFTVTTGGSAINASQATSFGGYGYMVVQSFGTTPDDINNMSQSLLRVYENGVELTRAHSLHNDISVYGAGRFSHWTDGVNEVLFFSASDNSDPATNGRTYTFTIGSSTPPPTVTNTPYGGVARLIPGTIQAEDYDNGGINIAYKDNTTGNAGGKYRTTESVDLGYSSKEVSNYLGWTQAGEWLKYSVNISSSRTYSLQLRVASANAGKSVRIEIDGTTIATVAIPKTGGADKWTTVTVSGINLTAGLKTLRLFNVTGGQNINNIKFI